MSETLIEKYELIPGAPVFDAAYEFQGIAVRPVETAQPVQYIMKKGKIIVVAGENVKAHSQVTWNGANFGISGHKLIPGARWLFDAPAGLTELIITGDKT